MAKTTFLSDAAYQQIGRMHGSDDIAREASEASARWARDAKALSEYRLHHINRSGKARAPAASSTVTPASTTTPK